MKKSTLIIILVIYVASIVAINFFGLSVKVYDKIINVTSVECINKDEEGVVVKDKDYGKFITVNFVGEADKETLSGTKLQLKWHAYPDNATNKDVQFIYDKDNPRFEFFKDELGRETGLILIYARTQFIVTIMSCDGTLKKTEVNIYIN